MTSLHEWLGGHETDALVLLLQDRPDAVRGVEPLDVAELADRLSGAYSLAKSLRSAPAPVLQLLAALLALGEPAHGTALRQLLDDTASDTEAEHATAVDGSIEWLSRRAIVWPSSDDTLHYPVALHSLMPAPLGLGVPARQLLRDATAASLNAMLRELGSATATSRTAAMDAVVAALSDADLVRGLVAGQPGAGLELSRLAVAGSAEQSDGWGPADVRPTLGDSVRRWALARGMVVGDGWSRSVAMPAEVTRALLGPGFRAPYDPRPPVPATHAVDPAAVQREESAAASGFAEASVAVLDRVARTPVPRLKSGGIGVRELSRLAKATGLDEPVVRLVLELADALALLHQGPGAVEVSSRYSTWRVEEPATRYVELVTAWWAMPATPTQLRDEHGKTRPVLLPSAPCGGCRDGRVALLTSAADLAADVATRPGQLVPALLWSRPMAHLVAPDTDPDRLDAWSEAEHLAVVALGSLTMLGRDLVGEDRAGLTRRATAVLPRAIDHAIFGSDLTAVVTGVPSGPVSAVLDAVADREGRGGATVWRFTSGSVRRALDEGADPDALMGDLRAIATGELPQPLRYLIADLASRHGSVRVGAAVTVLHGPDQALLAQVAADSGLRSLRLRQVAATVLLSRAEANVTVTALRKAGYLPLREDDNGDVLVEGSRPDPPPPTGRSPGRGTGSATGPGPVPGDLHEVARRIRAGAGRPRLRTEPREDVLARLNRRLGVDELRLLAHAIDTAGEVQIEYQSASGGLTRRIISEVELVGDSLFAWCQLRGDDRVFTTSRVRAVFPA